MLEKMLVGRLDYKETQPLHPKGNQVWIYIGRTNTEPETPILWPPDVKSWFSEKTLMLGKIESSRRGWKQRMRWSDGITTQWTWIWVDSGSWWWTGRPGVLQFMGSQRVRHEWTNVLNWTEGSRALNMSNVFNEKKKKPWSVSKTFSKEFKNKLQTGRNIHKYPIMRKTIWQDTCIPGFIAALFT